MKYTELLIDSFYNTVNAGTISGADFVYKKTNAELGDSVKLFFVIENNIIKDAKFQACGSVVLFACMSTIIDLIKGNSIELAKTINEKSIIKEIKQVSRCDYVVVSFAVEVLMCAIKQYEKNVAKNKIKPAERQVKVKSFNTSKGIIQFKKKEPVQDEEFENNFDSVLKEGFSSFSCNLKDEIVVLPKKSVKKIEKIADVEPIEQEDLSKILSESVSKGEVIETPPTKIEVRVLDEDESISEVEPFEIPNGKVVSTITKTTVKRTIKKNQTQNVVSKKVESNIKENGLERVVEPIVIEQPKQKIEQEPNEEEVIDEIDSITAKLSDALTKLNFKFDTEDDEN